MHLWPLSQQPHFPHRTWLGKCLYHSKNSHRSWNFLKCFLQYFIYLFLERGERRENERRRNIRVWLPLMCPPLGTQQQAHNPGTWPDWESNWQRFGSQDSTQSTEPHQPGLDVVFLTLGPRRGLGSLPALYKCTCHLCVCVYVCMWQCECTCVLPCVCVWMSVDICERVLTFFRFSKTSYFLK